MLIKASTMHYGTGSKTKDAIKVERTTPKLVIYLTLRVLVMTIDALRHFETG